MEGVVILRNRKVLLIGGVTLSTARGQSKKRLAIDESQRRQQCAYGRAGGRVRRSKDLINKRLGTDRQGGWGGGEGERKGKERKRNTGGPGQIWLWKM